MFDRFVDPCLQYVRKGGLRELIATSDSNLVRSLMNLLDCQFTKFVDEKKFKVMDPKDITNWIEGMFIFSIIWSFGGPLNGDSRAKFDVFIRKIMADPITEDEKSKFGLLDAVPAPSKTYQVALPTADNVFSYKFLLEKDENEEEDSKPDESATGNEFWEPWSLELNAAPQISKESSFSEIIVPTIDTVRYSYIMNLLISNQKFLLIIGNTGTGKSAYITEYLLNKADKNVYKPVIINFSAQTSSNQTQDIIMSKLDKVCFVFFYFA